VTLASITSFVGDHGVYAVFLLMLAAALVPAASELVMVYAGAVAGGAFASAHVVLFGHRVDTPVWAYVTMATTGVLANTIGCFGGWALGLYGGRAVLERYGRWLHVTPARVERAEHWFARFGRFAVPLGLTTPLVRSFVAIPAGLARMPFRRFAPLALLGCIPFCFGLAGGGWALGDSYGRLHHDFNYVSIAIAAIVVAAIGYLVLRRRSSKLAQRVDDSPR
jgi:membrane protein DedA with SNARE-associated domain